MHFRWLVKLLLPASLTLGSLSAWNLHLQQTQRGGSEVLIPHHSYLISMFSKKGEVDKFSFCFYLLHQYFSGKGVKKWFTLKGYLSAVSPSFLPAWNRQSSVFPQTFLNWTLDCVSLTSSWMWLGAWPRPRERFSVPAVSPRSGIWWF